MTTFAYKPCTKESQTKNNRQKKTAKQRGDIPDKARSKAAERSNGRCEWCGWVNGSYDATGRKWGLQCSHLVRRWKVEETTDNEIAFLCGPSVNTGTCHNKVDYTTEGRKWALQYHMKLLQVSE
jgi:hypothetical protein